MEMVESCCGMEYLEPVYSYGMVENRKTPGDMLAEKLDRHVRRLVQVIGEQGIDACPSFYKKGLIRLKENNKEMQLKLLKAISISHHIKTRWLFLNDKWKLKD